MCFFFFFAELKGLVICQWFSVYSRADLDNFSFQVSSGSTDVPSVQLLATFRTTRGVWADVQDPMLGHSNNLQSPSFPIPFTCLPAHHRAWLQSNSGPITQDEHQRLLTLCSIDFHEQGSWLRSVNMILKACGSHWSWSLGSAHATQGTRTHPHTVGIKVPRSSSPVGHQMIYNESHFAELCGYKSQRFGVQAWLALLQFYCHPSKSISAVLLMDYQTLKCHLWLLLREIPHLGPKGLGKLMHKKVCRPEREKWKWQVVGWCTTTWCHSKKVLGLDTPHPTPISLSRNNRRVNLNLTPKHDRWERIWISWITDQALSGAIYILISWQRTRHV